MMIWCANGAAHGVQMALYQACSLKRSVAHLGGLRCDRGHAQQKTGCGKQQPGFRCSAQPHGVSMTSRSCACSDEGPLRQMRSRSEACASGAGWRRPLPRSAVTSAFPRCSAVRGG